MIRVDAEEAKFQLPDLIAAAVRGEEVLIAANQMQGHPTVRLVVVPRTTRTPQYGSARGMIKIADDFDAPLADFAEYS
jgi:antitoxin (DNA-binding transcriptional repressor) of toxin-antitoxin stability system